MYCLQCESYMRLARESITQEEQDASSDLETLLADADDDKTYAAMGVAKTIGTVVIPQFSSLSIPC